MHPNERPNPCEMSWQVVELREGPRSFRRIEGPLQAMEMLVARWPADGSTIRDHAHKMCVSALEFKVAPAKARAAFVAALADAHRA